MAAPTRQTIYVSYELEKGDEFARGLFDALEAEAKLVLTFERLLDNLPDDLKTSLTKEARASFLDPTLPDMDAANFGIEAAVQEADVFLFIITPESLESQVCSQELDYAVKASKPIVPVLRREVSFESAPRVLQNLQWIDFLGDGHFDDSMRSLLAALEEASRPASEAQSVAKKEEGVSTEPKEPADGVMLRLGSTHGDDLQETRVTVKVRELLARATRLRRHAKDDPQPTKLDSYDASFRTLLVAFVASDDPVSEWFKRYVGEADIRLDALLNKSDIAAGAVDGAAATPLRDDELFANPRLTSSTDRMLGVAGELNERVSAKTSSSPVIDSRHVMGAYIYDPAGHERDLKEAGFIRHEWSTSFLGLIKRQYPAELEAWKGVHREKFPAHPPLDFDAGPSTHIATDQWTLEDSLGYRAYAYAIRQFMMHPQTRAPLTISIQAPWGGGKTSLMRMIQQELDPEAVKEVHGEAAQPRGKMTIKGALEEIRKWIGENTQESLPEVKSSPDQVLTVWFNAWKYESVNQVWAGLVDAIMRQVAARLGLLEREKFWLRLNLKRIDADRLRQRIHDRIFNKWWAVMRKAALVAGAALSASVLLMAGWWQDVTLRRLGAGGATASVLATALFGMWKFWQTKVDVEAEPAAVSLSDYLDIPDYNAELGFIHRVEADLRRVLASVPRRGATGGAKQNLRVVIFIDDLDRCSPTKVAQVVEAVNLFLAGDFNDCMFVLGMDTEMVAAALQAAHKDMIAHLPSDAGIPVGWRFMDKFVQLPFLIPPTVDAGLRQYTSSLLSAKRSARPSQETDDSTDKVLGKIVRAVTTRAEADREMKRLHDEEKGFGTDIMARARERLDAEVAKAVRAKVDEGIKKFTDENEEIRVVVAKATAYFRGNPRELKRFVNAFRFNYFLWWAHRAQGFRGPTLDQLLRWSVLSMKWPEVVRWLRRSGGNEWRAAAGGGPNGDSAGGAQADALPTRLRLLEEISGAAADLPGWQTAAGVGLRLKPDSTSWLNDDDLLQFLHEEFNHYPAGERLSDGAGKGLW